VPRGVEGYGASSLIRTSWLLSTSDELLMIVAIDTQVWVDASLPQLDELVREGLVVLDEFEVVRYVGRDPEDSAEQ
jgi:hypothetical protein